jgi:hypothetical protein
MSGSLIGDGDPPGGGSGGTAPPTGGGNSLPIQGASTQMPYSLVRDTQRASMLEWTWEALCGHGVFYGGRVTATTGFSLQVASGTIFHAAGVLLTLSAAATFTASGANRTLYLWGDVVRTAANQNNPGDSDTYALVLSQNETGDAPNPLSIPLAILTTGGAGITTIDNDPAGKYLTCCRTVVTLADHDVQVPQFDTLYLIGVDWSASGRFADVGYSAQMTCDEAGALITELQNQRTTGQAWWTIQIPSGALPGTRSGPLDLRLSVTLAGFGWSGTATSLTGAWEDLDEVELEAAAGLQAELCEARRLFRVLLLHLVAEVGVGLPPGLEGEFERAAARA